MFSDVSVLLFTRARVPCQGHAVWVGEVPSHPGLRAGPQGHSTPHPPSPGQGDLPPPPPREGPGRITGGRTRQEGRPAIPPQG